MDLDDDIALLLRLKRDEQPPPDYFENFLSEFRRRQRDELLRQPLWSICVERARDFVFRHNVRSVGILRRRYRGSGRVRRSNFNHALSATRHYSVRSPGLARSDQATDYGQRIGFRACGVHSAFQHAAGCSPWKQQGYSDASGAAG